MKNHSEIRVSYKTLGIVGLFIIIILLMWLVFLNLSRNNLNQQNQIPNCQGVYILYQGNCCLDENYNNICDSKEDKIPKNNNIVSNIACDVFSPCPGFPQPILFNGELCSFSCENNQCVAKSCQVPDCISNSDCRNGRSCDLNGKCI